MIGAADALPRPLLPLAQEGSQPAPDKSIELTEGLAMGMLEGAEPATQRRIEIGDETLEADAPRPTRLVPHPILEAREALLAHVTPAGFEPVAEELEAFAPPPPRTRQSPTCVFEGCSVRPSDDT